MHRNETPQDRPPFLQGEQGQDDTHSARHRHCRTGIRWFAHRGLANKSKIILADEPTGNLDSYTSETVFRLFREINRKSRTTFLIVALNRRITEEIDRIIEIKYGRIFADIKR